MLSTSFWIYSTASIPYQCKSRRVMRAPFGVSHISFLYGSHSVDIFLFTQPGGRALLLLVLRVSELEFLSP